MDTPDDFMAADIPQVVMSKTPRYSILLIDTTRLPYPIRGMN